MYYCAFHHIRILILYNIYLRQHIFKYYNDISVSESPSLVIIVIVIMINIATVKRL